MSNETFASGISTLVMICHFEAPKVVIASTSPAGTSANPLFKISLAIQLERNVFPIPVLPVNKRFFSLYILPFF